MAQEVIRYRICDRCWNDDKEVEAEVTDRFTLNGHKFAVDLCTDCSAELYTVLMHTWGDLGEKTGEPGVLDKPIRISTGPVPVPPATVETYKPALSVVRREEMPQTAERWRLTQHALERMVERGFDIRDVLWAAERPEQTLPSRSEPGFEERTRGGCMVVVNPVTLDVITVVQADQHRQKAEA